MKTNPSESRQLLLHNPQLAYAILQALVIIRVVDPEAAMKILHQASKGTPLPTALPQEQATTSEGTSPRFPSTTQGTSPRATLTVSQRESPQEPHPSQS